MEKVVKHTNCLCSRRTGHAMLHTLYGRSLAFDSTFIEYFGIDLYGRKRKVSSWLLCVWKMERITCLKQRILLLQQEVMDALISVQQAHILAGDGSAVYAKGIPLQDAEFIQFTPQVCMVLVVY